MKTNSITKQIAEDIENGSTQLNALEYIKYKFDSVDERVDDDRNFIGATLIDSHRHVFVDTEKQEVRSNNENGYEVSHYKKDRLGIHTLLKAVHEAQGKMIKLV